MDSRLVQRLGAHSVRVYGTAQEPYIHSSYLGIDPEVGGAVPTVKTIPARLEHRLVKPAPLLRNETIQMKRILLSTVALGLAGVGISGCVNLDEKLVTGVSSQYYATPDGLSSAVIASYAQLRGFYGREQLMSLTQVGTDTWMAADQSGSNNKDFDSYDGGMNSTVAPLANTWNPAYQAINTLNAALDRGPNTSGIPAATKQRLLAEAHFLRALNYFTLVQTFGDVTLNLHENAGVVATAVRDPAADVYKAILADLDTAVANLPVTQADYGRATKGAAQTLRSKVYLTRAYQSYSPGKQADFHAALADAKAVINSGTYSLEPVFADLWCVARAADPGRTGYCENAGYNQNHKEFIFTVQFSYDLTHVRRQRSVRLHAPRVPQPVRQQRHLGRHAARSEQRSSVPSRHADAVRAAAVQQVDRHAGRERHSRHALRRHASRRVWIATRRRRQERRRTCPGPCTSGAVINVGDTAAVFLPVHRDERVPPEQGVRHSHAVPDGCGSAADRRDVLRRPQQRERRLLQLAALPVAQEVPGQPAREPHRAGRRQGRSRSIASARCT